MKPVLIGACCVFAGVFSVAAIAAEQPGKGPQQQTLSQEQRSQDKEKIPGRDASQETSDRTPQQQTDTPLSQTTKVDGETSDRTPDK